MHQIILKNPVTMQRMASSSGATQALHAASHASASVALLNRRPVIQSMNRVGQKFEAIHHRLFDILFDAIFCRRCYYYYILSRFAVHFGFHDCESRARLTRDKNLGRKTRCRRDDCTRKCGSSIIPITTRAIIFPLERMTGKRKTMSTEET